MPKQTVRDLNLSGRKALVRVDFNVPHDPNGDVVDDRRIRSALPTLNHVLEQGGSLILVSHFGRPTGDPLADAPYRMDKIAAALETLIGRPVRKTDDTVGPGAQAACAALKPGEIVLLENVRFNEGEKKGDAEFAKRLAELADVYVNDAFGTCHRDEASMLAVPSCFPPERRAIGFLVEKELQILDAILMNPKPPVVAVMGGAKVSDKIGLIKNLLPRVSRILVGGAMSYTFLKSLGHEVGTSKFEPNKLQEARDLLALGEGKIFLPIDHVIASSLAPGSPTQILKGADFPAELLGADIGPETVSIYSTGIKQAVAVVWNGPMGKYEVPEFSHGTRGIAEALAKSAGTTAVGGGETAEAVERFGVADKVTHVSTGGGAFLEALEGKSFNSLSVIPDR